MMSIRRSEARGTANFGWLDARHSFSFGSYFDPKHMGFGPLRVINEDRIRPGAGFDTHGHQDMEIVTYVIEGALEHRDSLGSAPGSSSVIRPGDVQRMTAGTGIRHSEFNHSKEDPLHLLQIWILPEREGLTPGYEEKNFAPAERQGRLRLIAARDGRDGAVTIHQDADIHAALLAPDDTVTHVMAPGRKAWIQIVRGGVEANGEFLDEGDAIAIEDVGEISIAAIDDSELLLFDMA